MTVRELIEKLQAFDGDLRVAVSDAMGERVRRIEAVQVEPGDPAVRIVTR